MARNGDGPSLATFSKQEHRSRRFQALYLPSPEKASCHMEAFGQAVHRSNRSQTVYLSCRQHGPIYSNMTIWSASRDQGGDLKMHECVASVLSCLAGIPFLSKTRSPDCSRACPKFRSLIASVIFGITGHASVRAHLAANGE